MWTCRYCDGNNGMYYKDGLLEGMLCLNPECGRFTDIKDVDDIYDSDM
ncbi:hypothetical protein [Vulcanibacillus modesticaldus]|nr:hypothetical protein [Vulcanibacillus modesticaldus]